MENLPVPSQCLLWSYQVDVDGLLPVLLVVDAGVVDDDVQTSKQLHGLLEGVCERRSGQTEAVLEKTF